MPNKSSDIELPNPSSASGSCDALWRGLRLMSPTRLLLLEAVVHCGEFETLGFINGASRLLLVSTWTMDTQHDTSSGHSTNSDHNSPTHFFHHPLAFFLSIRPFRGIIRDVKARGPYYISDWTDGWNYRVLPATALTFFSKSGVLILCSSANHINIPNTPSTVVSSLALHSRWI